MRKEKEKTYKKSEGPKAHAKPTPKDSVESPKKLFVEQNPSSEEKEPVFYEIHHRIPDFRLVICDGSRSGRIVRRNQ